MNSRQIVVGFLIAAGIAMAVLLMVPVVHAPCIVVHGPTTAFRAQRSAQLFDALLHSGGLAFTGLLLPIHSQQATIQDSGACCNVSSASHLSCTLRC
jgi:hypothetical protein